RPTPMWGLPGRLQMPDSRQKSIYVLRRLKARHKFLSEFDYRHYGAEVFDLSPDEERDISRFLKEKGISSENGRFLVALAARHIRHQVPFLETIDDLIIVDEDACNNFIGLKSRFRWEPTFHRLSHAKFVLSGF